MPVSGRRLIRRKKEVIHVEGYVVDSIDDAKPDVNKSDEIFHFFGEESPETDIVNNYGTLNLGMKDTYKNNRVLDIVTEQDPNSVAVKQYRSDDITGADVWANVKNAAGTEYIRSWLIQDWIPGLPVPSGNPNDKTSRVMTGNGNLPRQFENAWIKAAKVQSGASPDLNGDTPLEVPKETSRYAVSIKALDETGGGFVQERVPVSAAMVDNTGAVDFAVIESFVQTLTQVTAAYILYLQSGGGVYPDVVPIGLRD